MLRIAGVTALVTVATWCSAPSPLPAQWFAAASWGESESLDAATSSSPVRSLRLGLLGLTRAGRLHVAAGVPLQPSEDLLWGQATVASSPYIGPRSRLGLGFQPDLVAQGYAYRDPVSEFEGLGGLVLAEPYVAYGTRSVRARLGGGFRASASRVGGGQAGPPLPGLPGASEVVSRTAGVGAADLRITTNRVSLVSRAEVLYLDGSALPHGELSVVLGHDHGSAWAGLDHWESDARRQTGWHVGASLELTARLAVRAAFGRSSGEPMLATQATETWSIGLRYQFADRSNPVFDPLPEFSRDGVWLRVPAGESSGRPSVAGSFNEWTPVPMDRSGDDWVIRLDLDPGYYELAFVDETGRWFVPPGTSGRRRDGMGGWVMSLVVR